MNYNWKKVEKLSCKFFQGDLNGDYAVRVTKFLDAYSKRPAPPVPGPNPDQPPLFRGYQVREHTEKLVKLWYMQKTVSFRVTPPQFWKCWKSLKKKSWKSLKLAKIMVNVENHEKLGKSWKMPKFTEKCQNSRGLFGYLCGFMALNTLHKIYDNQNMSYDTTTELSQTCCKWTCQDYMFSV